ncbi:nucleobase:cation symporter-2 family protein [Telmatospirillum sp.]|uniref:nucleobase:cation symporter-2 family protein n=1 Tax=Telmatospirillum sp. TaxID=2079197 RepID=UPI00284FD307|nr:nucleobase:cation symporter-2 family protein [Telmatospirillum sp.]MDR3438901.1 nucleobase:cation symporter-2 family protein [Telmatospirillum sp.]
MAEAGEICEVDRVLPLPRLIVLGLQHVLVMYAGAVAVPLILGGVLKLPKEQIALLISADLFACGLVTLIQTIGVGAVGIRLPVMMGVTFAAVGPMLAMAGNPDYGLLDIYGAVIGAGIFGTLVAPLVSRLLPLFPRVVTGSVITIIGITLMRVGINWAAGAPAPTMPGYGTPFHLGVALIVLLAILAIVKYVKGFFANIAVLLGIAIGFVIALVAGEVNFSGLATAHWLDLVYPFQFGMPRFAPIPILTMCLVMLVVMIESTGMFLAVGELTGKPIGQKDLARGLRTDGLGTLIGGIFNTFPYTSYSQNVGLIGVTNVRSRWVCATGGAILVLLGLFPKMAFLVASIPQFVLGGAGIVMFGMVAATGIRILGDVDYHRQKANAYIVAISIGFGMIPLVADKFFQALPKDLAPLLQSGILLTSLAAVLLNLFFNGVDAADRADASEAAEEA